MISTKLLLSFLECKVLVVVLIGMIKLLKENNGQKTQPIWRKLKLLVTEKFQSHFEVTLGIRTMKPTW